MSEDAARVPRAASPCDRLRANGVAGSGAAFGSHVPASPDDRPGACGAPSPPDECGSNAVATPGGVLGASGPASLTHELGSAGEATPASVSGSNLVTTPGGWGSTEEASAEVRP